MAALVSKSKGKGLGSSFDDFLKEEGIYDEVHTLAVKKVLSRQLELEMEKKHLSKSAFAKEMGTSRSALDRLLDPNNESVTLQTISKAAQVLGMHLKMELVQPG